MVKTETTLSAAPCDKCGYNGEGYYQPDKHPCAEQSKTMQIDYIWLVIEFEINSGIHRAIAAYASEDNARACAGRIVGNQDGKYYSLQSMVLEDVE